MKQRTNAELLEITTSLREDYQPEALAAAELELNSRNLSETEAEIAQTELNDKQEEAEKKKEKLKKVEQKLNDNLNVFHPFSYKSVDTTIKRITIGFGVLYLLYLSQNWWLIKTTLFNTEYWDYSILLHLIPLILYPIGIYGFSKIKKYGWVCITILITNSTLASIFSVVSEIRWALKDDSDYFSNDFNVEEIFGIKGVSYSIVQLLIVGGILYYLNTPKICERFEIQNQFRWKVIGITVAANLLLGAAIILVL